MKPNKQQLEHQLNQHFIEESRYILPLFAFYLLITAAFLKASVASNALFWWLIPSELLLLGLFLLLKLSPRDHKMLSRALDLIAFAPVICSSAIPVIFYNHLPLELLLGLTLSAAIIPALYIQVLSTRPTVGFYFILTQMSPLLFHTWFNWSFNPWLGQVCTMFLLIYSIIIYNIVRSNHVYLVKNIKLTAELADRKRQEQQNQLDNQHLIKVMSHEFRTPLAAICNASQLLEMDIIPGSKSSKYLGWIKQMTGSLQSIANELLLLTRIRSNDFQLHPQTIEIDQILLEAVEQHQRVLEQKHLTLKIADHTHVGPTLIHADQQCLSAIINIFISNAIEFSHEGVITIGYKISANGDLELYLSDQGIGMDSAALSQRLSRYQQPDTTAPEPRGLGLSLACQLATMIEGSISAYSQVNHGSTFRLCLPAKLHILAGASNSQDITALHPARALVIEDEPINLEILSGHLQELGYQTRSATTIKAAQSLLEQDQFDLLISDVHLPDGNGVELLNWVIQHPDAAIAGTQILVQTADEGGELATQLKLAGAADVLIKPYTFDQLKNSLQHIQALTTHSTSPIGDTQGQP